MRDTKLFLRLLLASLLAAAMTFSSPTVARADVLDDFLGLLVEVEDEFGPIPFLPMSATEVQASKELIECLVDTDGPGGVIDCIQGSDSPLAQEITSTASEEYEKSGIEQATTPPNISLPPQVEELLELYRAFVQKDFWEIVKKLGRTAICIIASVVAAGVDVCALIEELIEIGKAVLGSFAAVAEFFKDIGEGFYDAAEMVACELNIIDCGDGTPLELFAYNWVFKPMILPEGLQAITHDDQAKMGQLVDSLKADANSAPPKWHDPQMISRCSQKNDMTDPFCNLSFESDHLLKAADYYIKAVEVQWRLEVAEKTLPAMDEQRKAFQQKVSIDTLIDKQLPGFFSEIEKTLGSNSPTIVDIKHNVGSECSQHLAQSGLAHVERWMSKYPDDAATLEAKSHRAWCNEDYIVEHAENFASRIRKNVQDKYCPVQNNKITCPSLVNFDVCYRSMGYVQQQQECDVNVAKVGYDVAVKIANELKQRKSTHTYEIRNWSSSQPTKPADLVCVRPTQRHFCNLVYDEKFTYIPKKVVNCELKMSPDYEALTKGTATEASRLSTRHQEKFLVDERDWLVVAAPSKDSLDAVQNDPEQKFPFQYSPLRIPLSVDGVDQPTLALDADLPVATGSFSKDMVKEKIRPYEAGGPDQLKGNLLESLTDPVDRVGGVEQSVRPEALAGTKVSERISTAPAGQLSSTPQAQLKAPMATQPAAPMQTRSAQTPPGGAPTSPAPLAGSQLQTNALQAQPQVAHQLPDITAEPALTIGGKRTSWGQTVTVAAADAQRSANGVCSFPVSYAVRNAGGPVAGAFSSTLAGSLAPTPTTRTWPALGQKAIVNQSDTVGLKPGRNILTLTLDQRNQVKESNENNNVFRLTVTLTGECGTARVQPPTQILKQPRPKPPSGSAPKPQLPIRTPLPTQ